MNEPYTEYRIVAQCPKDGQDNRGTLECFGRNFSVLVEEARKDGYPRIIEAQERVVSDFTDIPNYPLDERTP